MKQITFYFEKDQIELNYPMQQGTESVQLAMVKPKILSYLDLPQSISELTLDYMTEEMAFCSYSGIFIIKRPGLAAQETHINQMLGYNSMDASNILALTNALINGRISKEEFDAAAAQECQTAGPNPAVTKFLEHL